MGAVDESWIEEKLEEIGVEKTAKMSLDDLDMMGLAQHEVLDDVGCNLPQLEQQQSLEERQKKLLLGIVLRWQLDEITSPSYRLVGLATHQRIGPIY